MATQGGLVYALRVDVKRLHETWMELLFPRQLGGDESVLGKWTPDSSAGWAKYRTWAAVGALVVALLYPLALFGYFVRFQATRFDGTAARLGVLGVVVLSVLVWGGLAVLARFRFSFEGFLAVVAAAVVATVAAALGVLATQRGGRALSVFVGYPLGVTAVFLPPVVAALYSPTVASFVFPNSENIAAWFLDNVFAVGGLGDYLRTEYDLTGLSYVGMWIGISVPLGWLLGGLVTLADVVRPSA
jgi:hypothetical protein